MSTKTANTIKAVQFPAEEKAALVNIRFDAGPLGPTEVLMRTRYTLASPGTELSMYLGRYHRAGMAWGTFPATPGYAAVAQVEAVGNEVSDLTPGDWAFCAGPHQSMQRKERSEVRPVPDGLALQRAPYARLLNVTFSTFCTTGIHPPETVMVVGLGLVGLLGAQLFRAGGYRVIGVDTAQPRLAIAGECGIDTLLSAVPVDDKAYRGRVGLVVDCTAHEQTVVDATWCVRKGGEIALVGVPMEAKTQALAVEAYRSVFRAFATMRSGSEWQIPRHPDGTGRPSWWGNIESGLEMLAAERIIVDGLHTMAGPSDCADVYRDLAAQRHGRLSVMFDWSGTD